jgi:hypothetical protein
VMNLDPKRDKMKIGVLLKTWIKNGSLKVVDEYDEGRRKDRPFVKGGIIINFDIKSNMRRRLNARGFTDEQIDDMSPVTAWQILAVAA